MKPALIETEFRSSLLIFCLFVSLHHFSSVTSSVLYSERESAGRTEHVSIIFLSPAFREESPGVRWDTESCFLSVFLFLEKLAVKFSRSVRPGLTCLIRIGAHFAHRDTTEGLGDRTKAELVKLVFLSLGWGDGWLHSLSLPSGKHSSNCGRSIWKMKWSYFNKSAPSCNPYSSLNNHLHH